MTSNYQGREENPRDQITEGNFLIPVLEPQVGGGSLSGVTPREKAWGT